MQNLNSVGSVLDSDGMTYPMLEEGGYDADEGTHVGDIDIDGEWWDNLSDADYDTVMSLRFPRLQRFRT
tara:strand:+ start:5612 stop:5818 length:207 start_codon:yes stop_codon:yes gene_type:complete